jgi:hypothetical protein
MNRPYAWRYGAPALCMKTPRELLKKSFRAPGVFSMIFSIPHTAAYTKRTQEQFVNRPYA